MASEIFVLPVLGLLAGWLLGCWYEVSRFLCIHARSVHLTRHPRPTTTQASPKTATSRTTIFDHENDAKT